MYVVMTIFTPLTNILMLSCMTRHVCCYDYLHSTPPQVRVSVVFVLTLVIVPTVHILGRWQAPHTKLV